MDFKGQQLSERLAVFTILLFAVVSFLLGYFSSSFKLMMMVYAAGVAMAFVISVPDWPYFNQHPMKWLDPISVEEEKPSPPKHTRKSKK
mmetsp:Transcript_36379/g.102775  ORF Transcript_36379/g.102775 Transcript_36379/m.102775 type:complete len:89 (+) Transcript_36379:255-521(+)